MLIPAAGSSHAARVILVVALVAGIAVRALCIRAAPHNSYKPDHRDNMAWSAYAWDHGPHRIFDLPTGTLILEKNPTGEIGLALVPHACNYPPLSAYVFWLQGGLWVLLDPSPKTVQVARETAAQIGVLQVTSRVIETPISRLVQAVPSCVFDLPLACGVGALVATLRRRNHWQVAEALGFAITFLAPPIVLDSAFWNQTDSWVTTWMVWSVWALITRRLTLAGVFWAAALLIKPQGILLAPVFAYAFLALRFESGGSWGRALAVWKSAAGLTTTVALATLPFTIADWDHAAGPLRWFRRSYVETIGADAYQRTTLSAFNVWWLHWMSQGGTREALDSNGDTFGIRRTYLGKGLLVAAIAVAAVLCARKWSWRIESSVAYAAVTCLAAFLLPTAVHERYIYYCIPFLIALAFAAGRFCEWTALAMVIVVATFELTAFAWLRASEPGPRTLATGLSIVTCVAFALILVSVFRRETQTGNRAVRALP